MSDLDVHSLCQTGKIGLGIELDRIDAVPIRPPIIGRELCTEESASQGESVVRSRKDRVRPKTKTRVVAVGVDGPIDSQPVLVEQEVVRQIVESQRQIAVAIRAR